MKFILLLKTEENSAAGAPPMELMQAIAEHGDAMTKAGVLLDTAGLAPSAMGTRVRLVGGKLNVTDGPFTETKELIASYAMIEVSSSEEAVEMAKDFMRLHQEHWAGWEGESEVRQVFGPEDYAKFMPQPGQG